MRMEAGLARAVCRAKGRPQGASAVDAADASRGGGRLLDADESDAAGECQHDQCEGEQLAHVKTPNGKVSAAGSATGGGGCRLLDDESDAAGEN
jgi:hypothetical protein